MAKVDQLQSGGIDLDPDEDLMPDPQASPPPVDLASLRTALVEDLAVGLDRPGRPATFRPDKASRDPERWCALATYGHPELEPVLEEFSGPPRTVSIGPVAFAEEGGVWAAYRGDRTPPQQVHTLGAPAHPRGDGDGLAAQSDLVPGPVRGRGGPARLRVRSTR